MAILRPKKIRCLNCASQRMEMSHYKLQYECRRCGKTESMRHINYLGWWKIPGGEARRMRRKWERENANRSEVGLGSGEG